MWHELRGVDDQVEQFRRTLQRGRLSHGYLFAGPEGVGKTQFARTLAKCLFCRQFPDTDLQACGECPPCRQMAAGTYPDYYQVGCPEGKRVLPLDIFIGQRENRGREGLCHDLALRPMAGNRKIAVIEDAPLMNNESANSLLKTLEEPPPNSLLILIATGADAVLPTIRSRCQLIRFSPLSDADLVELLLEQHLVSNRGDAEILAPMCEGSLAIAAQLADPALRQLKDQLQASLAAIPFDSVATTRSVLDGLDAIGGDIAAQRQAALWLLRFAAEFYRHANLQFAGASHAPILELARDWTAATGPVSAEHMEAIGELLDRIAAGARHLGQNMPVSLCLEGLFYDLGRLQRRLAGGVLAAK